MNDHSIVVGIVGRIHVRQCRAVVDGVLVESVAIVSLDGVGDVDDGAIRRLRVITWCEEKTAKRTNEQTETGENRKERRRCIP